MSYVNKLLNLFWTIIAATAVIVLTPGGIAALYLQEYKVAFACGLIIAPFYYLLLSIYFEHKIEKECNLNQEEISYLERFSPIYSLNFNKYCISRRRIFAEIFFSQGKQKSKNMAAKLIAIHKALMWLFYLECLSFVIVLIFALLTGYKFS